MSKTKIQLEGLRAFYAKDLKQKISEVKKEVQISQVEIQAQIDELKAEVEEIRQSLQSKLITNPLKK